MKILFKNWKTTSSGIVTIAGGVLLYLHDGTKVMGGAYRRIGWYRVDFCA